MKFTGERMIPGTKECSEKSPIFKEHTERYNFASLLVKNKKVLDIACGAGYGSKILLNVGAKKVYGGDISKETIEYCKNKYSDKKLDFSIMNAQKLPFKENSFDVVVSFETLEHVEHPEKIVSEVHRVLKKNGVFIVSTPNIVEYRKGLFTKSNEFHKKELTPYEFSDLLNKYFKDVKILGQRRKYNILLRNIIKLISLIRDLRDYRIYNIKNIINPIFLIGVAINKR